jgi:putative hydrolase of the HAD superfamily
MNLQPRWKHIGGIVLDAVGTLIKPVPSVAEAYLEAARRQGVELAREEVRIRFHDHFRNDEVAAERGRHSTDEATERRRWRRIVRHVLPEIPDPERAYDELWSHFGNPASWRCFADVGPTLKRLHDQGIALCIGSNFDGRLRRVVAGLEELQPAAEVLVISSEVGYRKPHAAFFAAACQRLGLPPEEVLCIGDDAENDVRGAIQAGLDALLLDRDLIRPPDLPSIRGLDALLAPHDAQV